MAHDLPGIDDKRTAQSLMNEAASICGLGRSWILRVVLTGITGGIAATIAELALLGRISTFAAIIAASFLIAGILSLRDLHSAKSALRVVLRARGRCEDCGYDLRGLAEARCPECGHPTDPAQHRETP